MEQYIRTRQDNHATTKQGDLHWTLGSAFAPTKVQLIGRIEWNYRLLCAQCVRERIKGRPYPLWLGLNSEARYSPALSRLIHVSGVH